MNMVNQKHFSCPLNWALCQLAALGYQNMTNFLLNNSPINLPVYKVEWLLLNQDQLYCPQDHVPQDPSLMSCETGKIQCTSNVKSEQPCYGLCSLTHSAPKTFRDLLLDGGIPGAGDVLGVPTNVSGDATWLFANYFTIISTFQVRSHAIVD